MADTKRKYKLVKKLTEAPDELGFQTDDEIEAEERAEFERKLAQRKADRDKAKNAELDRQNAEKEKQAKKEEAKAKGEELYNKCKDLDNIDDWFEFLVPSTGKADTVAGELVRAVSRIGYRYFNDGDMFFSGYGRETCGSDVAYLLDFVDMMEDSYDYDEETEDDSFKYLDDLRKCIYNAVGVNDDKYEEFINDISDLIKNYLLNRPDLFGEPNEKDSRTQFDIDDYDDLDEPRDYEYRVDLGYYDSGEQVAKFLNKGDIDTWELQDYIKYEIDNIAEEAEMERPWGHYDTEVTITNLTKDEYNQIEDLNWEAIFQNIYDELYEKYGDPEEEEEDTDYEDDDYVDDSEDDEDEE